FADKVQGKLEQSVEREVGDFVLRRADGIISYQLAVVVDDAAQGVTDVLRGADLLDSTARQIHLQRLLGVPTPRYLHIPIAVDPAGEKLSKQAGAQAIDVSNAAEMMGKALAYLGQPATRDLAEAARSWDPARIPAARTYRVP